MTNPHRLRSAAIPFLLLLTGPAMAENEFPSFQPGMWSFSSTVNLKGADKPQVREVRMCANPTDDIRKKWDALAEKSCKFSPITRTGNKYSYSSFCERDGLRLQSKSIIVVESSSAYRVETESRTNSQARKEVIDARRVGDCAG